MAHLTPYPALAGLDLHRIGDLARSQCADGTRGGVLLQRSAPARAACNRPVAAQ